MTPLSSKRKKINQASYNTSTVLTQLYNLQWKTIRRMVPPPFLDTIVEPVTDGKLSITVYRKPTHIDQYIQWDSHHHVSAKYSVINTLTHRAKTVCSNPKLLQKWIISERLSVIVSIPNGLWTKYRKDLTGLPRRSMMGLTARALQAPNL